MTASRGLRIAAVTGLVLAAGLIALMVLSPSPDLPGRGIQWGVELLRILPGVDGGPRAYAWVEVGLNVVLFVPLGVALALAWSRRGFLWATGVGFWASFGVEVAQGVFLSDRTPQFSDVVANTAGCAAGYLATALLIIAIHPGGLRTSQPADRGASRPGGRGASR